MCLDLLLSYKSSKFPTNFQIILRHDWGNYLSFLLERPLIFPVMPLCAMHYQLSRCNCFHLVTVFKFCFCVGNRCWYDIWTYSSPNLPSYNSPGTTNSRSSIHLTHTVKVCTSGLLDIQALLVSGDQDCNMQIMSWASAIAARQYYSNICNYYHFRFLINLYRITIGNPVWVWMVLLLRGVAYSFVTIPVLMSNLNSWN